MTIVHAEPPSTDVDRSARQPHAILDRDSRVLKARKIVALIGDDRFRDARRILEVGCGSGIISSKLAEISEESTQVFAVDVVDNRTEFSGYHFQAVSDTKLPFPDNHFDIVITNHVIEHVGDEAEQNRHLREIHRVVSPPGIVYLAVPNKWRLIEPHYRLPLLSWLPRRLSDRYIKLSRRGSHYDCFPLSHSKAQTLFGATDFSNRDVTCLAIRKTIEIELSHSRLAQFINRLAPNWALRLFIPVIPTYIFLLRPGK